MAKSQSAQANRDWFERRLQRDLSETDLAAVKEGARLTSNWSSRGSYAGLILFGALGFPYPRAWTTTFVRTVTGIARSRVTPPSGTNGLAHAFALAHAQGVEATGVKNVTAGTMTMGQFQRRLFVTSLVGMGWTLLGGIVGKAAGAFASIPFAERLVRERGGDVEAIRLAANAAAGELQTRMSAQRAGGGAEEGELEAGRRVGDSSEVMRDGGRAPMTEAPIRAAGDLRSRRDESAFLADDDAARPVPTLRPSDAGTRMSTAAAFDALGRQNERNANAPSPSRAAADEAIPPTDGAPARTRWDELRDNKATAPSAWERIRQDQGREAYNSSASSSSSNTRAPPSSEQPMANTQESEGDRRRREFEQLMDKERKGGDEAGEVMSTSTKKSRWL